MVFKFRMLSDENDNFVRDLEVPYDMTLRGFHEFLVRILGYEACMTSFFTADGQWERLQEYTLLDMGDPESIPMENVSLGQLLHHNRERLIYLFDQLNNRALYLELTEAKKPEPTMEYPRVAFEHAPAPDQYDPAANEDDGSIFEQMMDDFGEFRGPTTVWTMSRSQLIVIVGPTGAGKNGSERPYRRPLHAALDCRFPADLPGVADRYRTTFLRSTSCR